VVVCNVDFSFDSLNRVNSEEQFLCLQLSRPQ
jgi:hypothetical protein